MFNYNLQKVDYQIFNELYKDESHTLPLNPPKKGGSETRIRCFTIRTDILSMKIRYKVSLY